ncbi:Imm45 family immunity protein [Herbaspirillum huttiense]|uniref:Imm45 family immunity protein n=1 Tax=Herbaspirillum huttiense TaxID=863372 RepID=UPI0010655664
MKWVKLIDCTDEYLVRGTLLKFPAKYPFESTVVLMLCEQRAESENWPHALVTITGHKAGINPLQLLPSECTTNPAGAAVSRTWLIDHWSHWCYPDCDVENVWARRPLAADEL